MIPIGFKIAITIFCMLVAGALVWIVYDSFFKNK
jgi:hypothetical protein